MKRGKRFTSPPGPLSFREGEGERLGIRYYSGMQTSTLSSRVLDEITEVTLRREKEQKWREGFEAMGRDADVNNVEYLLPDAQKIVLDNCVV